MGHDNQHLQKAFCTELAPSTSTGYFCTKRLFLLLIVMVHEKRANGQKTLTLFKHSNYLGGMAAPPTCYFPPLVPTSYTSPYDAVASVDVLRVLNFILSFDIV